MADNNQKHGLSISLVTGNDEAHPGIIKLLFAKGVEAVHLAPTVINRQVFTITGKGNQVSMTYKERAFSQADLGIGKYHFELGAGKEYFEWV